MNDYRRLVESIHNLWFGSALSEGRLETGMLAYTQGRYSLRSKHVRGKIRYFINAKGGHYREVDPQEARELYDRAKKKLVNPNDAFDSGWGDEEDRW